MTTSSETPVEARRSDSPSGGRWEAGRPDNPSGRSRPAAGTQTRRPGGGGGGRGGGGRRPWGRRKVCQFCVDHVTYVDYKSVSRIRRYISERSRMESSKRTGTCTRHQRMLRTAILRARHMALLPYAPNHTRVTAVIQVAEPAAETPETTGAEDSEAQAATPAATDEPKSASRSAEQSKPEDKADEAGSEATGAKAESDEPEAPADDDAESDEPEAPADGDADADEPEESDDAKSGESDSDQGDVKKNEDGEEESSS